ncbi:MmcQ/YjbR family DNA-binding protein [Emticicia sp. W12TSBA100-4]|uniref:MmcQ/YjbR family DNA-binding protein n=1 Tax=Emticicia sp. W12TSBA100-4 TaxID=3160965 RepID=UPI00330677CF
MISAQTVRKLALQFEQAEELPHFDKASFRVKKKIFATLNEKQQRATLKLSENDQSIFSLYGDKTGVFPVPNKWGKQGWTQFLLEKVDEEFFSDALTAAYCEVAPKDLSDKYMIE